MTPMRAFDRVLLGVLVLAALALGFLAFGPASAATPATGDAHSVIAKMIGREPHLSSYTSRVHVNIKMLSFPYFAPKLDGTSDVPARRQLRSRLRPHALVREGLLALVRQRR